jgi:hypothetical protein
VSAQQRDLSPRPNQILATPDTPAQCATEYRTPAEQQTAAADAAAQRGSIAAGSIR